MGINKYFFFDHFVLNVNLSNVIIDFFIAASIAFILIVIIASYLRFQDIVDSLKISNSSDNDIKVDNLIRIKLADEISKSLRKKNSFLILRIKLNIDIQTIDKIPDFIKFLSKNHRKTDSFFNYSNSEIIVILQSDNEFASMLVDRLIDVIVKYFDDLSAEDINVGVCSFPINGITGEELLNSAEQALLKTDKSNRIMYAEDKIDEEFDDKELKKVDEKINVDRRDKKIIDPLTGVLNEKAISKFMQREISELRLKKKPCVIFSIKINNISNVKDYFGDKVLDNNIKSVSKIIQDSLRKSDIIGTYKYGEFIILAHCELKNSYTIGHRIINLINNKKLDFKNKNIHTPISIGAAAYPEHGNNIYDLYKKTQNVLVYCNENDISGYMIYDTNKHKN